jgi:hypothetical protein
MDDILQPEIGVIVPKIKTVKIGDEIVPDREKKSGRFVKGNKNAVREKRKEVKKEFSEDALASLLDSAKGDSIEVLVGLLRDGSKIGLNLQQVLKLCEAVAPYQAAKASKEADQDTKILINVRHINE